MEQMANASPEQSKKGMDMWMAWAKKAGSAVVDLGMPLGNGTLVKKEGIAKSTGQIAGYSILQGETIQEVTRLLADHPHLMMPGFSIEVHETLAMPGM
jgi:hypothetical protein